MYDKIIKIEELGIRPAIDIEVSRNHLFYANDILSHNSNSDVELTDTSESFGLPATADFMIALISTEELADLNQIMVKQLKNRYSNPDTNKRFVLGLDKAKMKLYDAEQTAQSDLIDSGQDTGPVFDKSDFGRRDRQNKFEGFKV